ncbi:MAG: TetR/AcrR family transcriptional regulator [Tabrizicola sp.]|jgi:AcrR family transcriptional regulator|nr:TetR/AcrR family transcriptional regulator [Tabrizicola sp.]
MTDAPPPRAQRNRSRILTAAQTAFLSAGYEQTSMDAVAAVAGVAKQTVYAHFGSKEALFIAMTDRMIDAAVAAQSAAAPDPGPDTPIADWLLDHARAQLLTATNRDLMQLRRVAIAEAERFPQVGAAVFEAGPARAIARLARIFAAWQESRQLNAPDPGQAAAVFNWLIMGGPASEAMLLGAPRFDGQKSVENHAQECVRVFLAAYGRA